MSNDRSKADDEADRVPWISLSLGSLADPRGELEPLLIH